MQQQCDSLASLASLTGFEDRLFDHHETASDCVLVSAIFGAIDRVTDPWLRVELDVVATVACSRWVRDAFESFESSLARAGAA